MKKTLLLLASAAMLLVGCAKEKFSPEAGDAEMVNMTVSALVQGEELTKAAIDNDGKGVNANRCIMVLYYGDQVYGRYTATVSNYKATFDVKVPAKRTYKAVFWADCAAEDGGDLYYNTGDLTNITLKSDYVGNDDKRDAFFKCEEYTVENKSQSFTAELTRPFAQINVISKDIKDLHLASLYPQKVNLSFSAATSFNAMSGECGAAEAIAYEADVYKAYDSAKEQLTLSMDYLFAGDRSTVDIDFKAPTEGTLKVEHNFSNIPYQRNYRTNIIGNLLTADAHWDVTINPEWNEPDEEVKFVEEGSIEAANQALAEGKTAILIKSPADAETPIEIPAVADGKNISIKTEGTNGKTLTFNGATGPANLYIASDAAELEIITPKTHVELNAGTYSKVTATTSATTLVIAKGVTVESLNVDQGNVEIHGIVKALERASGVKANWYADSREKLIAGLDKSVAGESVVLTSDIDLNNVEWTPVTIGKAITFDGGNHTIKNLKIAETHPDSYYALISELKNNGVIKNLTVDGAQILLPASKGDNSRGAALVGIAYCGNIINCHVKHVTVKAYQKVGGLIALYSLEGSGTSIVENCSSEDVKISENQIGMGVWGAGGLIGSLSLVNDGHNIEVKGCSAKGISISNSTTVAKPQQTAHAFIGVIRSVQGNPKHDTDATVTLANNTVEQASGLYTDLYSTDYFGWATNAEYISPLLCKIIIDGTPWTPDYSFQIADTGAKYATLSAAITAAAAGQTVKFLKPGTYTFPGNTKKAITVEGLDEKDADGNYVVAINLNGVSEYNENLTFKHLTFNFTNSEGSDRGFTHCVNMTYNECAFTGLMWGYDSQVSTFNDCLFHQATKYNVWSYGGNLEFNRCLFQTSTGTIVNVYATGTDVHEVRFNDCTFESLNDVLDKGAILLKGGNNHGHVIVNNYTLKGKFQNNGDSAKYINSADGLYMFSLRDGDFCDAVYITVNGVTHYPYFTIDANGNYSVKNVNGLKAAVKHWNALTSTGEKTITVADGTYELSDIVIEQNKTGKSLVVKAATAKGVTLKIPATPTFPYIFMVNGCSTYDETRAITFNGFKFDVSAITSVDVAPVMNMSSKEDYSEIGYPKATQGHANDYGGYITIDNCELIGGNGSRNDKAVMYLANSGSSSKNITVKNSTLTYAGYLLATYVDGFTAENVITATPVRHFINNQTSGITVKNCVVDCDTDYAIRANAGPVSITGSKFVMTYNGSDKGGIYVDRGNNTQLTMTGNTYPASYSGANMHDVYNEKGGPCIISNGSQVVKTLENGETYDFPRN